MLCLALLLHTGATTAVMAQGLPLPGQMGPAAQALQQAFAPLTPEQRRAFCLRVGQAAMRCGITLDMTVLGACLIRTLPQEDSIRAARVLQATQNNPSSLLSECGIGLR